jgi:hypothetical protein
MNQQALVLMLQILRCCGTLFRMKKSNQKNHKVLLFFGALVIIILIAVAVFFSMKPKSQRAAQLSAGLLHTCAIDAEGVKCWGKEDEGFGIFEILRGIVALPLLLGLKLLILFFGKLDIDPV